MSGAQPQINDTANYSERVNLPATGGQWICVPRMAEICDFDLRGG